jgi:hypothetical protein
MGLAAGEAFVPTGFVPESKFNPVPQSKFVKDNAKVILHHTFRDADDFSHFAVLESLGDKFDDLVLTWAGKAGSIEAV